MEAGSLPSHLEKEYSKHWGEASTKAPRQELYLACVRKGKETSAAGAQRRRAIRKRDERAEWEADEEIRVGQRQGESGN